MAKYRKRPVVVEAFRWDGRNEGDGGLLFPKWLEKAVQLHHVRIYGPGGSTPPFAIIRTLEGDMKADAGDYIIKGVLGELYPCKPEIFEATYEKVED